MNMKSIVIVLLCITIFACSPSSPTISVVNTSIFQKDTSINLEKVQMIPAQIAPRCMIFSNNKILIRTSTMPNVCYATFSYPEMKHLSYFGKQSEYVIPLLQSNDKLYLIKNDSIYFHKWVEGDSLKQFTNSYFYNTMGQRMLGVAKLENDKYAYPNNYFDKGVDEFFMIKLSDNLKLAKGKYPASPNNFKSVSDFKSAYAHNVLSKPDGSRLFIYYYRTRRCRIYDQDGILLHDILLNYEPCQTVIDRDERNRFTHIRDAFVTDNFIYILCPNGKDENSTCSILVANWNGEFDTRYRMDQSISYFFIDESLNRFCGINSNDPNNFYLFNLDEN